MAFLTWHTSNLTLDDISMIMFVWELGLKDIYRQGIIPRSLQINSLFLVPWRVGFLTILHKLQLSKSQRGHVGGKKNKLKT